jgi:exosortase
VNSPSDQPISANYTVPALLAAVAIAVAVATLVAGIPYTMGYGLERAPIYENVWVLWKSEEWQHCWIAVAAFFGIIWVKRKELVRIPPSGTWLGLPVLAFSGLVYWAGYRTDNFFAGLGALWIFIAGGILLLLGWRWMMALLFPWAFLFFALPFAFLEAMIAFRLRLFMSSASVQLLNFFGVDAIQQGTAILSAPNALLRTQAGACFSVDVADPCSGIKSLFALTMVTALYAYFTVKPLWKQFALFACSIPLAIAGNMARILMLTVGTIAFGPEFAIGSLENPSTFHMAAGFLVFIVALAGMILLANLLTMDWKAFLSAVRETLRQILSAKAQTTTPQFPRGGKNDRTPVVSEDTY